MNTRYCRKRCGGYNTIRMKNKFNVFSSYCAIGTLSPSQSASSLLVVVFVLQHALFWLSIVIVPIRTTIRAYNVNNNNIIIQPGIGLVHRTSNEQVLIFEHNDDDTGSTGGLVINRPTPVKLSDLNIPKFNSFANNYIMMGCGTSSSTNTNDNDDTNNNLNGKIRIGDMAPWFWIHNVNELCDSSTRLVGANGLLYMGGNIDDASKLISDGRIQPTQFKFFYKYKAWFNNELYNDLIMNNDNGSGEWILTGPIDPIEALKPYTFPIFPFS